MRAILLIDHGSVRPEANHMLSCAANLLQHLVGDNALVRYAHMELAEPSIAKGFADCANSGATEVIAFPYMLSPGKHVSRDVPRGRGDGAPGATRGKRGGGAAAAVPNVTFRVTGAFGIHEKLSELIAIRTGVELATSLNSADACKCWEPSGEVGSCGAACAAKQASQATAAASR